jgi:ribosomal protein S18 acetylase RimI-like enzyme
MNIIIRQASKDDARIIAEAVAMAIGTASVVHYCGEDYMTALQEVALLEGTQYSYKCALIAEVDGQPAGALCGYDGALLESLRERTLEVIRKYNPAVRVLDDETEAGEFYLDSIGVLPQFRGLGIGAMLLCEMTRMAHENGHEHVALIVDEDNPSAEKLYTRLGFRRVGTRIFFGHRMWHLILRY